MKYERVLIYTKKGNLLDFLHTDHVASRVVNLDKANEYYGSERDIQLIACIRWEAAPETINRTRGARHHRCYCRIKCPINPLPVKGEFELPSLVSLQMFLKADGWTLKQDVCADLFK